MGIIEAAVKELVNRIWCREIGMTKSELRKEILECFRKQFRTRYKYIVGRWGNAVRSKQTVPPKIVANKTVISYIRGNR